MCVKVIASQRWDVFLRHGEYGKKVQATLTNTTHSSECT